MVQAKKKYISKPGMKVKKATKDETLKVVNGDTGKTTDTGRRIKIFTEDNTPGSEKHVDGQKELNDLTVQVKEGARQIGLRFFEVGQALLQIQDKMLWRFSGHESFSKWLASIKEIRTPQTAYNMMSVARALDRNMAARYGPSVCYVIARANDDDARKELTRLAADGATTSELRLVAKEQRKQAGIKPKQTGRPRGTGKKAVERSVTVTGTNGVENEQAPAKAVKASAKARKRDSVGVVAGEKSVIQMEAQTAKSKTKNGWTLVSRFQLGENGPDIKVEVNTKKKLLKYEVM